MKKLTRQLFQGGIVLSLLSIPVIGSFSPTVYAGGGDIYQRIKSSDLTKRDDQLLHDIFNNYSVAMTLWKNRNDQTGCYKECVRFTKKYFGEICEVVDCYFQQKQSDLTDKEARDFYGEYLAYLTQENQEKIEAERQGRLQNSLNSFQVQKKSIEHQIQQQKESGQDPKYLQKRFEDIESKIKETEVKIGQKEEKTAEKLEKEKANKEKAAQISKRFQCFERAAKIFDELGKVDEANSARSQENEFRANAQARLAEDKNRETLPANRGNLTTQANMELVNRFISLLKERAETPAFTSKFPGAKFDENWWNQVQQLCLTETELDFQTRTFHDPNYYNAQQNQNQISFEVNCSIVVQFLSKCIRTKTIIFQSQEELEQVFDEVAYARYLIQVAAGGDAASDFYRKPKEFGYNRLSDPIPLNSVSILYLRELAEHGKFLPNTDGNYVAFNYAKNYLFCTAEMRTALIDELSCVATQHVAKYDKTEAFHQLLEFAGQQNEAGMKHEILDFIFDFSRSSTYSRGQGALSTLLVRTLLNVKGLPNGVYETVAPGFCAISA